MPRIAWKLLDLAGVAGVAATGVVIARRQRDQEDHAAMSCATSCTTGCVTRRRERRQLMTVTAPGC